MFSRYYAGRYASTDYIQRYRESPHKARIDHVARALVALRYRDAVVVQHLREWVLLRTLTILLIALTQNLYWMQ